MIKKIRHLFQYCFISALIQILARLGIDNSSKLMGFIARKIMPYFSPDKVARNNLISTLNPNNVYEIMNSLWDNLGRFIGEMPYVRTISHVEIQKRVSLEGFENIQELQKKNQPFLLFTGHFANWEIALRRIAPLMNLAVLHRKTHNPYIEKLITDARNASKVELISRGNAEEFMRAIRTNRSIVMLVDQKVKEGMQVPFLGKQAPTSYGIARLALKLKYPIIPVQIIRLKGAHFRIVLHPKLKIPKLDDKEKCYYEIMLSINKVIESWIKENPSQWWWFHNRWDKSFRRPKT